MCPTPEQHCQCQWHYQFCNFNDLNNHDVSYSRAALSVPVAQEGGQDKEQEGGQDEEREGGRAGGQDRGRDGGGEMKALLLASCRHHCHTNHRSCLGRQS